MNLALEFCLSRAQRATKMLPISLALALSPLSMSASAAAAKAQRITDKAHLKLSASDGETITEVGTATGTLPGEVRITVTLHGSTATSTFRLRTSIGTLSGTSSGSFKDGKDGYDSFGGSLSLIRGTGFFKGASGHGGLYGSIYRVSRNEPMSVQVTGTLRT
jgi:hypothetical protein